MTNIYEFFRIPNFSTIIEVKKAYRRLALEHHPDRGGSLEKMKIINEMYEIICKRKDAYDQHLKQSLTPKQEVTVTFWFGMGTTSTGWSYAN